MPAADDSMKSKPLTPKSVLEDVLSSGKVSANAVISALEAEGFSIIGGTSEDPMLGDGEEPAGMRAERNPPDGTGGEDTKAMGEPMDIDQIGSELFEEYMGGAAPAT